MSVVAVAAPVASVQHGLVHLRQLRELGITPRALQRAIESGELVRLHPEVYVVAGAPRTWRRDVLAAVLDAGPGAAASHRTAAVLLRIARRGAPELVEISVPRQRSSRLPATFVHRSGDLTAEHVLVVDGIPCTGPLRTLLDLGAVERPSHVADAFERALQSGVVTLGGAEWILTEIARRGRNGCGVFRRVLDDRALAAASPHEGLLEPRMARLLRNAGLPPAIYQHRVVADGVFVAQVDFGYPDVKEAFEVDGFEAHGTPTAMTLDFEREHRLKLAGWGVTRFTWKHVVRRPKYVAATVASVLGAPKAPVGL